ncbi:cupin domain-containing protein [Sulfitobacter sp. JBTF-M27]|uniref:Cupin domain-containing protein n=1 Tax=Sulfitobacter sediminilitoris TaxID=2698830 RepID=A0A6P0C8D2_9RHOB|nr:cupin domain-containing protein [Sulfitobacter sediminilitoris]NEK22459.1 cupin domain-containing protein [Sulfitobacter sediminilitoris]
MIIHRVGSRPSTRPSPDYFVGTVRMDPLITGPSVNNVRALSVTFEPGARTNWHTHPLGQTLIVTAGAGLTQKEGEEIQKIFPGDVITFAPGERHWHGASADCAMTHIALQQEEDGRTADWMEPVTDAQYGG